MTWKKLRKWIFAKPLRIVAAAILFLLIVHPATIMNLAGSLLVLACMAVILAVVLSMVLGKKN